MGHYEAFSSSGTETYDGSNLEIDIEIYNTYNMTPNSSYSSYDGNNNMNNNNINNNSGTMMGTYTGPNGSTATLTNYNNYATITITSSTGVTVFTCPDSSNNIVTSDLVNCTFISSTDNTSTAIIYNDGNYYVIKVSSNGIITIYTPASSTSQQPYPPPPSSQQSYFTTAPAPMQPSQNINQSYNNSLPPGVPIYMIPPGQEDLYILKSEVVPPVCPACNDFSSSQSSGKKKGGSGGKGGGGNDQCPPCPACARCPEPSFECKKVPNYDSIPESELPLPVLNDFSMFGT